MSNPYVTTLTKLRALKPCASGWQRLLSGLNGAYSDADPLPFAAILPISGLDDTLWGLKALSGNSAVERDVRLYAAWCARQTAHLNSDPRVMAAIEAAEGYARGTVSDAAWAAAGAAAWDAAGAAARDAARAAAEAAAEAAAGAAAWAAARAAAGAAAWDAAGAAAWDAAGAAAWDAAWAAARAAAGARLADLFDKGSF